MLAERNHFGLAVTKELNCGDAVGQFKCRLETVSETATDSGFANQPINDDVDVVLLVAGELRLPFQKIADLDNLAVHLGPCETLRGKVLQQCLVFTFTTTNYRGKYLESCPLREFLYSIDDLLRCLP